MKHVLASFAALVVAAATSAVPAHEPRQVGPLRVVVGWHEEPAVAGHLNAVHVIVSRGDAPVANARLKATVTFGDKSTDPLSLSESFDTPGEYTAAIVPTDSGSYSFQIRGTIGTTRIDQTFKSGPGTFDDVRPASDLEFPDAPPSRADLATRLDQSTKRLAADADDAASKGSLATILAIVALVLAAIALLLSLVRKRA